MIVFLELPRGWPGIVRDNWGCDDNNVHGKDVARLSFIGIKKYSYQCCGR